MTEMTGEQLEELGSVVDTCANYSEYGAGGGLSMLPEAMRIDALSNGMAEVQKLLRDLYLSLGGEDAWG